MISIGLIGCGRWGLNHLRVFSSLPSAKIKVCCDQDKAVLQKIRCQYPQVNVTGDYRAVFNDAGVDAVIIATPTVTHYALAMAALKKGKHVFCEKPLSVRQEDAKRLSVCAQKKHLVLMVGYVFLSNNGIIALKQEVASGKLGRLLYLHFTRINLGPIRDDVDVIYDLASHDIAIASFLLGSWPSRASANAGHLLRRKNCDSAYISLTYPQDITAHIHVSWLDPHKVRRLTCIGDKKMATWDDLNPFEPVKIYDKGVIKERQYSDFAEFQLLPREGPSVSPWVQMVEPLKLQDQHFLDSINNRKCPLITDGEFGYKVTKVLQALESSVRDNGRSQQLRWK